ncbi:DUF4376 domain-containing protein [Salmonella enterica subsp. enterica serovar Mikawasima]|nr:DUF4376 domain-containing protein [Salmonella enterica subsp. enterica serovar Mikawasima]EID1816872.1 DUF4376 domain-containing protein [Salmonella enterica subsp. enterica serovar Mikawasima]
MIILKSIQPGPPKTPEQAALAKRHHIIFLFSQDGQDWYDVQKNFANDTLKVGYDSQGIIRVISTDVSAINPTGLSVTEVPNTTANRRADISGRWGFDGENIIDLLTLGKARSQKHDEINQWRDTQENANYVLNNNSRNWDYGKATQERLALSVQMAKQNRLPQGFIWTDVDNNDVPMTAGELLSLSDAIDQAMFTKGLQIHMRQREMKEAIDKLTDVKAVMDYVIGWPDNPTK